jgi:hypothetical protein
MQERQDLLDGTPRSGRPIMHEQPGSRGIEGALLRPHDIDRERVLLFHCHLYFFGSIGGAGCPAGGCVLQQFALLRFVCGLLSNVTK